MGYAVYLDSLIYFFFFPPDLPPHKHTPSLASEHKAMINIVFKLILTRGHTSQNMV